MEGFHGLTAEMYQAIVAIVDDRLRDVRVTREGFERLEGAIVRLVEAQAHTAERMGYLETRLDRVEIVGEGKHNLALQEADRFAQQVERARQHLEGQVYAVCFAYRARPEVRTRLQELGIPLLFSYGRFA